MFAATQSPILLGQTVDVPNGVTTDLLVDIEGEDIVYIGFVLLVATIVIAVGALNRALKNAITFALFLSMTLIVLIVLT